MRPAPLLVLGFTAAGCLSAQFATATGPVVGGPVEAITFDTPTRSLRAVMGSPGAATFGPALLDNLELASVAPLQSYGVIFQGAKCLFATGLGSKAISNVAIAGVAQRPDAILWSGNGSLAILYSFTGSWFQTVTGFPNAPVAGQLVDVSALGGSFTAIAVDTPGKQIALALSGDKGTVYVFGASQSFTPLVSMAKPLALSFSSDGETLFALDGASLDIAAINIGGHGLQTLNLPGMSNPIAVQAVQDSQNRQLLYVAAGSDRILRVLDVATGQTLTDVALSFQPTSLYQFGSGTFVAAPRTQSSHPLWLFTSTPQPAAYFVPAIQLRRPNHPSTDIDRSAP